MFSGCTVPSDSKETELERIDQEASPSAGKNTGMVLVPCLAWKCVPTAISSGLDIFEVPRCHNFSVRVTKITSIIVSCLIVSTFLILTSFQVNEMTILSKGHKLDNFES